MAATFGILDKKYVSAIPLLDQREIMAGIVDISNEKNFADIMRLTNRMKSTKEWIYHQYTKSNVLELIDTTGATITNSGTPTVTVVLASAALSGYVTRGLQLRIGTKTVYVYNVTRSSSVATMIIKSYDGSNVTLTAGTLLPTVGASFGEGSGAAQNIRYDLTKYFNYIQTFREHDEFTDVQGRAKIEVPMADGSHYYTVLSHAQKIQALYAKMSNAMIASQVTPNGVENASPSMTDVDGNGVQTTRGLDQYVTSYGINDQVTSTGVVVLADITDLEDQFIANRAPKEFFGFSSTKARRPYSTYAKNLTGSSGIVSTRLNVDGREVDMMIDKLLTPGGFTFDLTTMPILDNPQGLGAVADISGSIYFVPKGNAAIVEGGVQPYIQMRYIEQYPITNGTMSNLGNAQVREQHGGGLAPIAIGSKNVWETDWTAYAGLECIAVQHFAKQKVVF